MSSICKKKEKKKGMKGRKRGCDQRTKIRCIYRHGSRPRGPNTMWRVSRKTNSASQRTAVCSSCERWNLPSKRSSESCLSISPLRARWTSSPYLRGSSQQEPVVGPMAAVLPCSDVLTRGWSLHGFCFFYTPSVRSLASQRLSGPVVSLSGVSSSLPSLPRLQSHSHTHTLSA